MQLGSSKSNPSYNIVKHLPDSLFQSHPLASLPGSTHWEHWLPLGKDEVWLHGRSSEFGFGPQVLGLGFLEGDELELLV